MDSVLFLNVVLNSLVVIVLLAFSRRSLERIRRILDLLNNGGFRDCPYYADQRDEGRRWYDSNKIKEWEEIHKKGGEDL